MKSHYLFCGDREWNDRYIIDLLVCGLAMWAKLHREKVIVMHGAAPGADSEAGLCAERIGLEVDPVPAEWSKYKRAAGPIRNRAMLKKKPKVVLAFHDDIARSKGTKDMCNISFKAGVPVYVISRYDPEVWK